MAVRAEHPDRWLSVVPGGRSWRVGSIASAGGTVKSQCGTGSARGRV